MEAGQRSCPCITQKREIIVWSPPGRSGTTLSTQTPSSHPLLIVEPGTGLREAGGFGATPGVSERLCLLRALLPLAQGRQVAERGSSRDGMGASSSHFQPLGIKLDLHWTWNSCFAELEADLPVVPFFLPSVLSPFHPSSLLVFFSSIYSFKELNAHVFIS